MVIEFLALFKGARIADIPSKMQERSLFLMSHRQTLKTGLWKGMTGLEAN